MQKAVQENAIKLSPNFEMSTTETEDLMVTPEEFISKQKTYYRKREKIMLLETVLAIGMVTSAVFAIYLKETVVFSFIPKHNDDFTFASLLQFKCALCCNFPVGVRHWNCSDFPSCRRYVNQET